MEKYIKADTVLKFINGCLEHEDKITDIEKAVLTGVKICVERISAADVVEVRHGRWIPDKEDIEWGNSLIRYRCSECKGRPHFDKEKYRFVLSPYCPNCGAKMNGGQNDG